MVIYDLLLQNNNTTKESPFIRRRKNKHLISILSKKKFNCRLPEHMLSFTSESQSQNLATFFNYFQKLKQIRYKFGSIK